MPPSCPHHAPKRGRGAGIFYQHGGGASLTCQGDGVAVRSGQDGAGGGVTPLETAKDVPHGIFTKAENGTKEQCQG